VADHHRLPRHERDGRHPAARRHAASTVTDVQGQATASWRYSKTAAPSGVDIASYTYNAAGQTAAVADDNGNTWTYGYDADGNLTSQSTPAGHSPGTTTT